MMKPSYLLIGGTGTISTEVLRHLTETGRDVTCITRGIRPMPEGVKAIVCDADDTAALTEVMRDRRYDVVVDFITFTPEQAEARANVFLGRCGRYVFISTATVYQKPPRSIPITADTVQDNPYWDYSQRKIACEQVLRRMEKEQGLPLCIIRPSWTYGDRDVPFILRPKNGAWTLVSRMRQGKPVLVPGDGNIFWTITHAADLARALVGLMDLPETLGEDFHLTQDEYMTWNDFAAVIAEAAGAPAPELVHVATDRLCESDPDLIGALKGDKAQTAVFDNSKVRRYLPDFRFEIPFAKGIARSIAVMDADPSLQQFNAGWDAWVDEMIRLYGQKP